MQVGAESAPVPSPGPCAAPGALCTRQVPAGALRVWGAPGLALRASSPCSLAADRSEVGSWQQGDRARRHPGTAGCFSDQVLLQRSAQP